MPSGRGKERTIVIGMSFGKRSINSDSPLPCESLIDELRRPSLARALNRGEHFAGHPLARLLVLEVRRPELIDRRNPGDPFHVRRDVDLERTLRVERCSQPHAGARRAVDEVRFA